MAFKLRLNGGKVRTRWVFGEEHPGREEQVQRPWGRDVHGMFEEEQRPVWLEESK